MYSRLEAANAFAKSFAKLGQLFRPEHKKRNPEDHQQMQRLKQSFQHKTPFVSRQLVWFPPGLWGGGAAARVVVLEVLWFAHLRG
jgi:hypothetical protein